MAWKKNKGGWLSEAAGMGGREEKGGTGQVGICLLMFVGDAEIAQPLLCLSVCLAVGLLSFTSGRRRLGFTR